MKAHLKAYRGLGRFIAPAARVLAVAVITLAVYACSSTKHVPDGRYLLDNVDIRMERTPDGSRCEVSSEELIPYLRQMPNHKVLGFLKLQLATYSLSGRDSTKWYNRWLQRVGKPPVIYDPALADASARQLQLAMINRGYMDATVTVDTVARQGKKKMNVSYTVTPGPAFRINSVSYDIPDEVIAGIVLPDSTAYDMHPGALLDRNMLDRTRTTIAERLNDMGYYGFSKEYITFVADTVAGSTLIDITMQLHAPGYTAHAAVPAPGSDTVAAAPHRRFKVRKVVFFTGYRPGDTMAQLEAAATDTVECRGIDVVYGSDRYIKPGALEEKCFVKPGQLFSQYDIDRTYESLMRLGILRSVSISTVAATDPEPDGYGLVDVYLLLSRNRKQSVTFELEGTNSEGDLGVGGSVTYQHRNLGHRSETFTAKVRANYESISGDFDGFINDRYTEYAAEVGLTFPKFLFPFLSRSYKRRVKATSEVVMSFNYQERPEYTRIIAGTGWKYRWNNRYNTTRRTFDLVDVQYVYLPKSTNGFINQIAPDNPLLRYSYEDHFIMRMGYTYQHTNRRIPSTAIAGKPLTVQPTVYNWRLSAETAGNLLYGLSHLVGQHKDEGVYRLLGVPYSQYAKFEGDYAVTFRLGERHSVALHAGAGVAVPYGNSRVVPFEKRFYAGGANGVRGWAVRTLGPGSFDSRNSVSSFMDQCGDISLLMSAEYRFKMFWVLEGGLFVDAGNIWTIRDYPNQPGGLFTLDNFWKEIAASYGVGLRLDFTYFLFRLDLGIKAYNPARNQESWPLIHPRWKRDTTLHFSVGYPF